MSLIHYDSCPACDDKQISFQLVVKDYTVSQQSFPVWECKHCTIRFTQDIPDQMTIGDYYKSENYISHTDTKKGIINSLYHIVRKRTLTSKASLIHSKTRKTKGNLLDIGAGTGAFSSYMKERGWDVQAVEPDEAARATALQLYNLRLKPGEALWDMQEGNFDAITMWHVLEHVHDIHGYLEQILKLLQVKGKAFIAVPNYTSYDADYYKEYWAAYDVPRHLFHFSPASIKMLANRHALKLHSIEPMWFDSFYVSMLSEKYRNGSGNLGGAFLKGLRSNSKAMQEKEKCSSLIYVLEKIN